MSTVDTFEFLCSKDSAINLCGCCIRLIRSCNRWLARVNDIMICDRSRIRNRLSVGSVVTVAWNVTIAVLPPLMEPIFTPVDKSAFGMVCPLTVKLFGTKLKLLSSISMTVTSVAATFPVLGGYVNVIVLLTSAKVRSAVLYL